MSVIAEIDYVNSERIADSICDYDFFVSTKGYEDRSYHLLSCLLPNKSIKNWIIIDFRKKLDVLSQHEISKYNSFDEIIKKHAEMSIAVISLEDYLVGNQLRSIGINSSSKVAMEITSIDFWELSNLLFYLLKIVQVDSLDIYYTEPYVYNYSNNDILEYNTIDQQVSINYIPEYYSSFADEKEMLVTILGFHKSIANQIKEYMEVAEYYSINGFPSYYPKAKDISRVNNYAYLSEIPMKNQYSSEATNPFLCYNTLIEIAMKSKGALTICPLGSKPMSLGACLYALDHEKSARIIYPFKNQIQTRNEGIGRIIKYRISK